MSLYQSSLEARERFLKKFTSQLIEVIYYQRKAERDAEQERLRIKREIEIAKLKNKYVKEEVKEQKIQEKSLIKSQPIVKHVEKPVQHVMKPSIITAPAIPKPVKPPVQPTLVDTAGIKVDFGKIQAIIDDPLVTAIECQGEKKNLIITKNNQIMKSEIKLERKDIDYIINEFSDKARIPLIEGMLRARIGNLQISAVVSETVSSRFIITKTQVQELRDTRRIQLAPIPENIRPGMSMSNQPPRRQFPIPPMRFIPPKMPPQQMQPPIQSTPQQMPLQTPQMSQIPMQQISQPPQLNQPVQKAQPPQPPELPQPVKVNNHNELEKK